MSRKTQDESLDATFVALADPTRRAILRRLARSEARVTALAAPFQMSLNSVSKHIKLLERAGLVERRRAGREHILRFRDRSLRKAKAWIAAQEAFWQAGLQAMDDFLTEETSSEE